MARWTGPLIAGAIAAAIAGYAALEATPNVLMKLAEHRIATLGGINRLAHAPVVTAASRAVVRPSPDLLYSSCVFDASRGAVLVDVPAIPAPYWSLSVFDQQTNVAFVRNNLQTGGKPMAIAIVARGASAPADRPSVAVPGGKGIALVRILIDREKPLTAIDAARRQARCRPAALDQATITP